MILDVARTFANDMLEVRMNMVTRTNYTDGDQSVF